MRRPTTIILSLGDYIWAGSRVGGSGGSSFNGAPVEGAKLAEIRLWTGKYVDAIQLVYILPDGRSYQSPRFGGSGGGFASFTLSSGEYIKKIDVRGARYRYIDQLRFTTNKGRQSERYGGGGGDHVTWDPPQAFGAVAFEWFNGASGKYVDSLTPYFVAA